MDETQGAPGTVGDGRRELKWETALAILRLLVSFAVFVGLISFVGWAFRDPLSSFGHWFVDRFGVVGMASGAFLADSCHFPIPPQFYLLTGIAGGHDVPAVVLAVLIGSEIGGLTAFALARSVGGSPMIARRLKTSRELLTRLVARQGALGLALATLLPVSYSLLCMAGGAMRLPYRAYGVFAVMRVPRILLSYLAIVLVWPR